MVDPMQAIEFAQDSRRRRACVGLAQAGNQDFDARAKNKGFLLLQWRPAAPDEDAANDDDQPGQGAAEYARGAPAGRVRQPGSRRCGGALADG